MNLLKQQLWYLTTAATNLNDNLYGRLPKSKYSLVFYLQVCHSASMKD